MEERKCKICGTTEKVDFDGMCQNCYLESIGCELNDNFEDKTEEIEKQYSNLSNSSNLVANKFLLVTRITKVIGYALAIIIGIILMQELNFISGLITGICIAISTWFSTLGFEATAEALKLLQDIKNKL